MTKTRASRSNAGKLQWSLIDWPSLEPLVKQLEFGAVKYSRNNWKQGFNKEELLDSLTRHVIELHKGNEYDESGVSHVGAILFNAMAYEYCRVNDKFWQYESAEG